MTTRRTFLCTGAAALTTLAAPALANGDFRVPWGWRPRTITINAGPTVGGIYVDTANTWLYYITGDTQARRYKIAVGAAGRQFQGTATIRRRAEWPSWTPTANMIRMEPDVYGPYRRGLPGGHERNPLGSRALYLYRGSRDTLYRIHGTPQPWTMGQAFSSGCVRLINDHMNELYDMVPVGTQVIVS
jgi:lipoprotein-anchoring transpeptidase ErfK/SrfK